MSFASQTKTRDAYSEMHITPFYLWLIEVGKIKVQREKKLNKRKVKERKLNKVKVKVLVLKEENKERQA